MGRNSGISWNGKVFDFLKESDEIVLDSPDSCAEKDQFSDRYIWFSFRKQSAKILVIRTLFQTLSCLTAFSYSLCCFLVISLIIKRWVTPEYSSWFSCILNMSSLTWAFFPFSSNQVPHSDTCFKEKENL